MKDKSCSTFVFAAMALSPHHIHGYTNQVIRFSVPEELVSGRYAAVFSWKGLGAVSASDISICFDDESVPRYRAAPPPTGVVESILLKSENLTPGEHKITIHNAETLGITGYWVPDFWRLELREYQPMVLIFK